VKEIGRRGSWRKMKGNGREEKKSNIEGIDDVIRRKIGDDKALGTSTCYRTS
jgi:hypothetical protein